MPFHSTYSTPTARQLEAIGGVAANWALLEYALEILLSRLAMAPGFPALALTNNLSIDNRLAALRNLIAMHRDRYSARIIPIESLTELSELRTGIARIKGKRNKIIHYVWFRQTDEKMFGHRFKGARPSENAQTVAARRKAHTAGLTDFEEGPSLITTVTDLRKFAARIEALSDKTFALCEHLPDIDEERLARSLVRTQDRQRGAR